MLQYAGPGTITRSLSDKGTSWEISWHGRNYQRNVMHMHHYKPDQHVLYEQRAVHDNNIMVGSYVAVLDTAGDANYHVAKVVSITETCTKLHYLGTKSTQLRSAVWRYLFHQVRRGRPRARVQQPREAYLMHANERGYASPLTGDIDTLPMGDSLVVLPNLGFNDHMQLSRASVLLLRELPHKHHVYMKTWH